MAIAVAITLVGFIGFGTVNSYAQRIAFSIATGPSSGTYFPVGETIAGLISHPPGMDRCLRSVSCGPEGLIASAQTSAGAYANVLAVENGRANSALAQSDVVAQAVAGKGVFKKPQSHIRVIAALFPEQIHLVVSTRSHIASLSKLRGKHVSLGAINSGTAVTARAVLTAYRLRAKMSNDSPDIAVQKLQAGTLDAFFFVGGAPVPLVDGLIESGQATLLPIDGVGRDRLLAHSHGLFKDEISSGTYGRLPAVATVAVQALWIVSDREPKDTVFAITRALFSSSNRNLLIQGPPAARAISLSRATQDLPAPLHAGAEKFYRDVKKR
ncbi:MAG: TAXI family TRAP transporter solute-binding subunit [Proteobacteria bacterium]|nr:TAXI family TRAP transporter solute-binding subunit [Pseudomonadota bacterium]